MCFRPSGWRRGSACKWINLIILRRQYSSTTHTTITKHTALRFSLFFLMCHQDGEGVQHASELISSSYVGKKGKKLGVDLMLVCISPWVSTCYDLIPVDSLARPPRKRWCSNAPHPDSSLLDLFVAVQPFPIIPVLSRSADTSGKPRQATREVYLHNLVRSFFIPWPVLARTTT